MDPKLRQQMIDEMDQIFAMFPELECKGLCDDTCGQEVTMTGVEIIRLAGARPTANLEAWIDDDGYHHMVPNQPIGDEMRCRLLEYDTAQCSAYADRPAACRGMHNIVDYLCPHGCISKNPMYEHEFGFLLMELKALHDRILKISAMTGVPQ